ncbi:MAG: TlpA disulfide reductase family protein [Phycisphaerales bacterium]|jgi:thiol-disulfide isomerase/thioredoxin|nr:TlpA disulfide reductase family protein [Phycisphaerales bacterium]
MKCLRPLVVLPAFLACVPAILAQDAQPAGTPTRSQPAEGRPTRTLQPAQATAPQAASSANVDPVARQVLEAARDAIAAAPSLSFQFSAFAEGNSLVVSNSPTADGTILLRPGSDVAIRVTGAGRTVGLKEDKPFDVSWRHDDGGEWVSWADEAQKKVFEQRVGSMRGSVAKTLDLASHVRPASLLSGFTDELAASSLTLEPSATFDGVNCRVVLAELPARKGTVRWAFGAEDNLPRRWERVFAGNDIEAAIIVDLHQPARVDRLADNDFVIPLPDGYQRERIETPVRRAPQSLQPGSGAPARSEPATRPALAPVAPPNAPAFTAKDANGNDVSLAALKGNVVVLDFWGTWCLPCKKSSPEVQKLHERFKDSNVQVIGVASRERDAEAPKKEFADKGYTFTLIPKGDDLVRDFGIRQYPTFVIIGVDGELIRSIDQLDRTAGQTYEQLLSAIGDEIEAYLAKKGG